MRYRFRSHGLIVGAMALTLIGCGAGTGIHLPPTTNATVNRLEKLGGRAALYGDIRVRIKGLDDETVPVLVKVGSKFSPSATIAFAQDQAPPGDTNGGAVDFRVPAGLTAGNQVLLISLNGATLPPFTVKVTNANPHAVVTLDNKKSFVIELRQDKAPKTVANFVGLASGTKPWKDPCNNGQVVIRPIYGETTFHRAVAGFVRQGGDPLSRCPTIGSPGTGDIGFKIAFENTTLLHDDGAVAMARSTALDSAACQFYICDGPQHSLDPKKNNAGTIIDGYVVFGKVVEGLDVAKAITITQTSAGASTGATPTKIQTLYITSKLDTPTTP